MTATKAPVPFQLDLIAGDVSDANYRDQREVMERPFVSLSKRPRKTALSYKSPKGDVELEVTPNIKHGMATIWDWDIMIWANSQISLMIERDEKPKLLELAKTRTLHFYPAELLLAIHRGTGGRDRKELQSALERLTSTYVTTNLRREHQEAKGGFHWLDSWGMTEDSRTGKVTSMHITLSNWCYKGFMNRRDVLALDSAYFSLTGGYERWMYRVARKHAHGSPDGFSFALDTLFAKSGSAQEKRGFKRALNNLVESGRLSELGYNLEWREGRSDLLLHITTAPEHEQIQKLAEIHGQKGRRANASSVLMDAPDRFLELVNRGTLQNMQADYPNENLPDLFIRFVRWNKEKGQVPRHIFKAFRGFVEQHRRRQ